MNNGIDLKTMKLPKELNLIIDILTQPEEIGVNYEYKGLKIDWDQFLQLAFHHRVYPLLYKAIIKEDFRWVPDNVIQKLATYYKKNTFRMLYMFGEMEELNKVLHEKGIKLIFLKGPVLGKDLYGDISNRTSGDIDVLVQIDDLNEVDQILIELGYEKDEYIKSLLGDWKWRHHHFTYFHPQKGIKVEIHWRLNPSPSVEPSFKELWEGKREHGNNVTPLYFLGAEHLFFFLVTHGARHGWSRLRWLLDIHQLIKKKLDWRKILILLRKYQCEKIGGQSLILSASIFQSKVPNITKKITEKKSSRNLAKEAGYYLERLVNLHESPLPEEIAKFHAKHLFCLMSFKQKLLYLLSILHPIYSDAERFPLPEKLHFLYFPLKPFLWVLRKRRKQALS